MAATDWINIAAANEILPAVETMDGCFGYFLHQTRSHAFTCDGVSHWAYPVDDEGCPQRSGYLHCKCKCRKSERLHHLRSTKHHTKEEFKRIYPGWNAAWQHAEAAANK